MPIEVAVHQTAALTEYCEERYGEAGRWRAAERAAAAFEDTWRRGVDLDPSADVWVVREPIEAPIQAAVDAAAPTDANDPDLPDPPCSDADAVEFDTLLDWWEAYCECHDGVGPAADSNLLLTSTNESSGGRAWALGPPYAVAQSGRYCAEAPDPGAYRREPFYVGRGQAYSALSTVLHEIGHNLIGYGDHHYMGTIRERRFTLSRPRPLTVSPMSSSYYYIPYVADDDGANYCGTHNGDDVDQIDRSDPTYDTWYSPCAISNMEGDHGAVEPTDPIADDGESRAASDPAGGHASTAADRRGLLRAAAASPTIRADGDPERAADGDPERAADGDDGAGGGGPPHDARPEGDAAPKEPDLRVVDASGAATIDLEIRPADAAADREVVRKRVRPAVASGSGRAAPAGDRGAAVETIDRLDGREPGRYEVVARRDGASAATAVDLGPEGARPAETVQVRVQPDGTVRAATAVTCRD